METEIKLTKNEIEALKSGKDRKQATVLLRLLNRLCKNSTDPKKRSHFSVRSTKYSGYAFEEEYSRAKQMETFGHAGHGMYTCISRHGQQVFGDSSLCSHLRSRIEDLFNINAEVL